MSEVIIFDRIQLRRGTTTDLASVNEVLREGEACVELTTGKFKIGDGSTAWNSLAYQGIWTLADIRAALDLLGSTAPGDLIRKGASGWERLPIGSNGQGLVVASGLPTWGSSGASAMSKLGEAVTASSVTALTLSGIDSTGFKSLRVVVRADNATASAANLSVYFATGGGAVDTTVTNYWRHSITATSSAPASGVANDAILFNMEASDGSVMVMDLVRDNDGRWRGMTRAHRAIWTSPKQTLSAFAWTTNGELTSIQLSSSVANSLLSGGCSIVAYGTN